MERTERTSCRKTKAHGKCQLYSHSLLRCTKGYVNPTGTIKEAVEAYKQGLMNPCPLTKKGARVREIVGR